MRKNQSTSLFDDRYTMSRIDRPRLLLPNAIAYSIDNEREAEDAAKLEAAKVADTAKAEAKAAAQKTMPVAQNENDANPGKFFSIRLGTSHDFSDAVALADQMLPKSKTNLDNSTFEFSRDMFVGVSLSIAYSSRPAPAHSR